MSIHLADIFYHCAFIVCVCVCLLPGNQNNDLGVACTVMYSRNTRFKQSFIHCSQNSSLIVIWINVFYMINICTLSDQIHSNIKLLCTDKRENLQLQKSYSIFIDLDVPGLCLERLDN